MSDLLYIGRLEAARVAFAYVLATDTVNEAVRRHDCDPVAAHVLGRALAAGILAGAPLGGQQRLNVRWAYEGALRTVVVDSGPDGATRGFVTPAQLSGTDDPAALYGAGGSVQAIRTRKGAVVATGHVQAGLQDVVEDLAYFHSLSDQVETGMTVLIAFTHDPARPVSVCRGLAVQALPGCDLVRFGRIRERLRDPAVRQALARLEESDSLLENALNGLVRDESLADPGLRYHAAPAPHFRCTCARDKMGAVLRALPYADRMEMVQKKEDVVVACRFCGERYTLTLDDCIRAWNGKA